MASSANAVPVPFTLSITALAPLHSTPHVLDEILLPLELESPLIFQPSPIALDTTDLFSVIIGNGTLRAGLSRIRTVSLDTSVEALLFLHIVLVLAAIFARYAWARIIYAPPQWPVSTLSSGPKS